MHPRAAQPFAGGKRSKLSPAVNVVHATMVDSRHAGAAAHAGGACAGSAQYVVTILGIASQAVNEARYNEGDSRPNPSSAERSPRMRASEPSASRKERERQGSQEDDFQVYFGDLPSPRMIEVVKPKEVQLPSWRVTSAAKSAAAETRRGAAGDSDSSDEDTNDAVFQSRHNRALERAVAAAKVTLTLTLTLTLTRSLSLSLNLTLNLNLGEEHVPTAHLKPDAVGL